MELRPRLPKCRTRLPFTKLTGIANVAPAGQFAGSVGSGSEAGLNTCCEAVRNRGAVAQVGLHVKRALVDPALWALKDITLEATWCYHITMWPRIIGMVERGVYPIERIITSHIKADDVVERGFKPLLDPAGKEMKVLVTVN